MAISSAPGPGQDGQGAGRGKLERRPTGQRGADQPAGIGVEHGVEHLVVRQVGLDEQRGRRPRVGPTRRAARARRANACSSARNLGASSSASKSRKVTTSARRHPVQDGLRPDEEGGRRLGRAGILPGHLDGRAPGGRADLLRQRRHPRAERHQRRGAARLADDRPFLPAAGAAQQTLAGLSHGGLAPLAPLQGAARPAGQAARPARRVQHAHDDAVRIVDVTRAAGCDSSDCFHGSSRDRSTISRIGQPARSSLRLGSPTARSPPSACRAARLGTGDTSRQGTPPRRARSTATSRACQVGDALLLQGLVVLVQDHHGGQVRHRRPRSQAGPDHDVDSPGRGRPVAGRHRHRQAGPPQPRPEQAGVVGSRDNDQRRTRRHGGQQHGDRVRRRRTSQHAPSGGQEAGRPGVGRARRGARPCRRRHGDDGAGR